MSAQVARLQPRSQAVPAGEILLVDEVSALTRIPVGTLRYWRHEGRGPRSFKLGERKVGYYRADVEAWLQEQYAATDRTRPEAGR